MATFAPEDIKYFEQKAVEASSNQEYYKAILRTIKKLKLDDPYDRAQQVVQ